MASLFRATVMLASLAAGVWAFFEYGPTEQVRPLARRALELAQEWIDRTDPAAPQVAVTNPPPAAFVAPQVAESPPAWPAPVAPPELVAETAAPQSPAPGRLRMEDEPTAAPVLLSNDPPAAALGRLESLGATGVSVHTWGGSGQFYRASCELPIANQADMTRHVEAVATDRAAAVADLLRQVEDRQTTSYPVAALR